MLNYLLEKVKRIYISIHSRAGRRHHQMLMINQFDLGPTYLDTSSSIHSIAGTIEKVFHFGVFCSFSSFKEFVELDFVQLNSFRKIQFQSIALF